MTHSIHIPVLLNDVVEQLSISENDIILDGTLGFGGHASALIPYLETGRYIGIDQDEAARTHCKTLFKEQPNITIVKGNFSDTFKLIKNNELPLPTKYLLDIGYSSYQLDHSKRGFSFQEDEPLDMRMDLTNRKKASHILNTYKEQQLSDIFYTYGELRQNKKLAHNIVEQRRKKPFKTTFDLLDVIKKSYFFNNKRHLFIKTCSQVFQALRIEVNNELGHLTHFLESLEQAPEGALIAIISFHSLEDRLIKHFVKNASFLESLTKKPIQATQEEIIQNSRSKSAKLRVFKKI